MLETKWHKRFYYSLKIMPLRGIKARGDKSSKTLTAFWKKGESLEQGKFLVNYTLFRNTFITNSKLKLAKNWANAKQNPRGELWLL